MAMTRMNGRIGSTKESIGRESRVLDWNPNWTGERAAAHLFLYRLLGGQELVTGRYTLRLPRAHWIVQRWVRLYLADKLHYWVPELLDKRSKGRKMAPCRWMAMREEKGQGEGSRPLFPAEASVIGSNSWALWSSRERPRGHLVFTFSLLFFSSYICFK